MPNLQDNMKSERSLRFSTLEPSWPRDQAELSPPRQSLVSAVAGGGICGGEVRQASGKAPHTAANQTILGSLKNMDVWLPRPDILT